MTPNEIFQLLSSDRFGAYAMSADRVILFWNSGAQRILGHRSKDVLGHRCHEILSGLTPGGICPGVPGRCPSIRDLRAGLTSTPIRLRMDCASGQRKLGALTTLVVWGVLEDGPLLAHLLRDPTDEEESVVVAGSVQDTPPEIGAPALLEDPGVAPPMEKFRELTPRELEVLRLVSRGWRTSRIADELGLSHHTVRNDTRHFRRKLGAATKLDAVLTAIRRGILPVG